MFVNVEVFSILKLNSNVGDYVVEEKYQELSFYLQFHFRIKIEDIILKSY